MASRPHLLYVAWGYPPCRGSGVYRAWATANAFAQAGWKVTVLTAPRETFTMSTGIDASLEAAIDPTIEVIRVPFDDPKFANDIRSWSAFRAHAPELWQGWQTRSSRRSFPEPKYGGWRRPLERAALKVHRDTPVDLTIGTANPNVDFVAGHILFTRFRVPYVMDYRDAWSLDIYSGERVIDRSSRAGKWEANLLQHAERVWFVNEPIRSWHAAEYPASADRFFVVENGYDYELELAPKPDAARDALAFGYIGTISAAIPMKELVDGWAVARARSPLVSRSRLDLYGYLNHMGTPGQNLVGVLERFDDNAIRYLGPVQRGQIAEVYSRFDALVLTFGSGRYITGGKVYEYASTGLPIISVHDPANETTRILADHPWWRGVNSLSPEDIASALIEVAHLAASQTGTQQAEARTRARRFAREAQLRPQIEALTATIERYRRTREAAA